MNASEKIELTDHAVTNFRAQLGKCLGGERNRIDNSVIFNALQSRYNDFTSFVGFIQRTRQPY